MLRSLFIENYALIEKLDISFDEGLTTITGETGAGKSILLGALGLILGQRADTKALFNKESKCIIEGVFDVTDIYLDDLFSENELDYENPTILRREITPQGKSRAFVNDTPVNLPAMKLFAERLIDIHSQHENLLFSNSTFRYNLIDSFAGINQLVTGYRKQYHEWQQHKIRLGSLTELEKQMRAELDYLQFQFDELHKAELIPGEIDDLTQELEILQNAGEIKLNLTKADYLFHEGQENLLSMVNQIIQLFKPLARFNPSFDDILGRLDSAGIELKDIGSEIGRLKMDVEDDPAKAEKLQQRFDLLQKLLYKHNVASVNDLISLKKDFEDRIRKFQSLEEEITSIEKLTVALENELLTAAGEISTLRKDSVPLLEQEINSILMELGMPHGRFLVSIQKAEGFNANGFDLIDFLFTANAGAEPQQLARIASGGELSRLMLAVKSVISIKNLLPTIIFDEIDTGVSGEIGFKIGSIMHKIARNMQVITVTHLPQMAAKGKKHFKVYKTTENQITKTFVKELTASERIHELAQMLGGANPGPAAVQAAEELFNTRNINQN